MYIYIRVKKYLLYAFFEIGFNGKLPKPICHFAFIYYYYYLFNTSYYRIASNNRSQPQGRPVWPDDDVSMTCQDEQLPHKQTSQLSLFSPTKNVRWDTKLITHMHRIFVFLTGLFLSHSVNGDSRSQRRKVYVDSLPCFSFLLQFYSVVTPSKLLWDF